MYRVDIDPNSARSSWCQDLRYEAFSVVAFNVNEQLKRSGYVTLDGAIRQFHTTLEHAAGKALQRLGGWVGIDRREASGMSGIQRLEQMECANECASPYDTTEDEEQEKGKARVQFSNAVR
jgi:hypothetical protein